MSSSSSRLNARLACVGLILLLGFGLRVYRLAAKDIWWDEGWGVVLSRMPLAESLQRTASDEHPPAYYWSLHFWRRASGDSPFAARFFSVLTGTLTLAVVFNVGRRLGGARLGALAALLLAFSRFHILWSQEIKMYTLAALFGLLSFGFMVNWKPNWRSVSGYGLCALGAIYSHYIALLLVLTLGLGGLLWGIELTLQNRPLRWRWLAGWVGMHAGITVLLIPWGLYLLTVPHLQFTAPPPIALRVYPHIVITALTLGLSSHIETLQLTVFFFLIVGVAALPTLWARRLTQRLGYRQLLLSLVISPALIYALSRIRAAELFAPKFDSRYLLILVPLTFLALGWGLHQWTRWRRTLGLILTGVALVIQINFLPGYYVGRHPTADFVTLMKTLTNLARPGDVVLLYTDKDWPVFEYYNSGRANWVGLPNRANLSPSEVALRVDPLRTYPAVWVVKTPDAIALDPRGAVLARLAKTHPFAADIAFGKFRLQLFTAEPRPLDQLTAAAEPQVRLERSVPAFTPLKFLGYDLPVRELAPGDYFPVSIYFANPLAASTAEVSLQLRDAQDTVLREAHHPLAAGANFITEAFPVSLAWAGKRCHLRLVMQRAGMPNTDAFALDLASVTMLPATANAPPVAATDSPSRPMAIRRHDNFGDLIWLEGSSAQPVEVRPGDSIPITLYWRAQQEIPVNYTVFVHLLGEQLNPQANNFLWGQVDSEPQEGRSPTSSWVAGQSILDSYQVQLSPDAPSGDYQIEVGWYDHTTGERLRVGETDAVLLGSFRVP